MKKFLHLVMLSSILLGVIANPLGAVYAIESQAESTTMRAFKETTPTINETGKIKVELGAGPSQTATLDIKAVLYDASKDVVQKKDLTLVPLTETVDVQTLEFTQLSAGTYTIELSADGYQTYRQNIQVTNNVQQITVYTDFLNGYDYQKDSNHPGVLRPLIAVDPGKADLNGDGQLNKVDQDLLIDKLQEQQVDAKYDLNDDTKVDLVDLYTWLVQEKQYTEALEQANLSYLSTIESQVALTKEQIQVSETTVINGDLADLLAPKEDSVVGLQAKDAKQISAANPVEVAFDLKEQPLEKVVLQTNLGDNAIEQGLLEVQLANDQVETFNLSAQGVESQKTTRQTIVNRDEAGNFVINLGGQVAVKKVTIKVTQTTTNTNLAEISKVEFVNGMEDKIPEPEMSIPSNLKVENGSNEFVISWTKEANVSGYEVEVTNNGKSQTYQATENKLLITSFAGKKLVNNQKYQVRVRSVNGKWTSNYSEEVIARPMPNQKPPKPDNITVTGTFKGIEVAWKAMDDTDSYTVYYKAANDEKYTLYGQKLTTNKVKIENLKDDTLYQVYVVGHNNLGDSEPSLIGQAKTKSVKTILMPRYKLINTSQGQGKLSSHIEMIIRGRGQMVESPLDTKDNTANGLADNDFNSYLRVEDWDEGGAYPGPGKGITVKFDTEYEMNRFAFAEPFDVGNYTYINVRYLNENNQEQEIQNVTIAKKKDSQGNSYYDVKFPKSIKTKQLRIGVGRYGSSPGYVTIAEMNFYHYDSLEDDINALFKDSLHLELQSTVDEQTLAKLQERLNTKDATSDEYIMDKENLQAELDMAKAILEDKQKGDVLSIDPTITAKKDTHLGFASGLNAWQPLGISGQAGQTVTIYVGTPTGKIGDNTPLSLVPTQYYAESNSLTKQTYALKVGKNEITLPELTSLATQQGGPLYIAYNGNNNNDQYSVRVSGGIKTATLNLHNVIDKQERLAKVTQYLADLKHQVDGLTTNKLGYITNGVFGLKENVANTSDIQLQNMMLSLPATQILAGLNGKDEAQTLLDSLDAMDQMMTLFYQHKGLSNATGAGVKNALPSQHLNIRYMRMFAGAFMYAGGNHIGIEWDQTPGMVQGQPIIATPEGKYQSGNLFGWGIAHEIGHNINQASYAIAEITNNYFAQLAQAKDSNESVRWNYADVFKKVTSNTKGQSNDVFTQLAMYWQLRLAYDKYYNYKLFSDYASQFDNLFYARVDSYARTPASAPQPQNVALQLNGGVEQNFMRLASAAAQKDLSEFFLRWGMVPDQTTTQYMEQFEKETRAIYYADDDAHTYSLENVADASIDPKSGNVDAQNSKITVDNVQPNRVKLVIKTNLPQEQLAKVHGYEISRTIIENGQPQTQVVGFSTTPEYTDVVASINNRVVSYSVRIVDKNLNYLEAISLGSVKISSDGSHDKSTWKVSTNMTSTADQKPDNNDGDPDSTVIKSAITNVIDNKDETTYAGKTTKGDAYVEFDFGQILDVCGLKFTGTATSQNYDYTIQISQNGTQWQDVKQGTFTGEMVTPQTVYFANESSDKLIGTYDARYVRLNFVKTTNQEIIINEIDVLGPSGDNVEFGLTNGQPAVFELKEDYVYDETKQLKIPKGSLIFTGKYKGNPAYNVVLLYDQAGKIVGGVDEDGALVANQIILADIPVNGNLGETSDGTFIYWLDPEKWNKEQMPTQIRAELYRVDNAQTNEGQRLVADTNWLAVPSEIEKVTIEK